MRALFLFLLWPALVFGYPLTPDPDETPGRLCTEDNSDFSEFRYDEQIPYCERNVSSQLKKSIYEWYSIPTDDRKQYTIDHLIPLSIGGDNSRRNLWPEHKEVKALRPQLEMELYTALRDGQITQREAVDRVLEEKFDPQRCKKSKKCREALDRAQAMYDLAS